MGLESIIAIIIYLAFGSFIWGLISKNNSGVQFICFVLIWPLALIAGVGHFVRLCFNAVFSGDNS